MSLALTGMAACGGGSDEKADTKPTAAATASAEPTEDAASPTAEAASGDQPEWAKPATQVGDKIATIEAGDISVDVYQVGVAKASKDGLFVDPDKKQPIIAKGADIVFVNYVVTNTGDPIDLGSSFVDVSARYGDWKYMQGMDTIVDSALYEEQQVNSDVLAVGGYKDPGVYTFGTGQTFSYGENFLYQSDSPIEFDVTAIPVDAEGELLHDKKIEAKGAGTIK